MSIEQDVNYVEKFAPLIHILGDVADVEDVAGEPGYTQLVGEKYKEVRIRALQGYMEELSLDFEGLKNTLINRALMDPVLARALNETERALLHLLRKVRLRIFLEHHFAAPKPSIITHPGYFKRMLVRVFGRPNTLLRTLRTMDLLRARLVT